jgi:ABC-2 type transport system ATP-binding protein
MTATSHAPPVVRIQGLEKRFRIQRTWRHLLARPSASDLRVALEGINLEVRKGEFFGLLGQNGAGKTTLFKILATLILPDGGTVEVDGVDVVRDPATVRRSLVPVIPSDRSLYWRVSAEENLRLYAALYGLRGAQVGTRVNEALEIVGLEDAGRKQVGLFSSGMKQRLLIARALLGRPRVLLLDEPTRSLDPVSAREFRRFLRERIGGDQGATVLLATHDHEEVTELCERVGVLDRGRLLAVGETERILADSLQSAYELWTPDPAAPDLVPVVEGAGGVLLGVDPVPTEGDRWVRVRLQLPAGEDGAAALLTSLVQAGVPVSRFARTDLSLADLLERVAGRGARPEGASPDRSGSGEPRRRQRRPGTPRSPETPLSPETGAPKAGTPDVRDAEAVA